MPRRLVLTVALAVACLAGAPAALACGTAGYSYAGISSRTAVSGVSTHLTALAAPAVQNGHVAAWVGVGGPGQGPHGSTEWIQVGYAGFPGLPRSSLYYEVALPGHAPTFHEVSTHIAAGETHLLAVGEVAKHSNWWQVTVDGKPVSPAYHLPGSHNTWRAIATAENWGGGQNACNLYSYRFNHIATTTRPGGRWQLINAVYTMHQANNRFQPSSTNSFTAHTTTLPPAPRPTRARTTPTAAAYHVPTAPTGAAAAPETVTPAAASAPATPAHAATDDDVAVAVAIDLAQPSDADISAAAGP
jgi:hypothetical protein